jgi:predicted phage terminase large subunit-like protein
VSGINPDDAAKAQQVGGAIGLGQDLTMRNAAEVKRIADQKRFEMYDLMESDPILGRQMMRREFASVAHDDIPQLTSVGALFKVSYSAANSKRKDSDYTAMWVIGLGQDQNYYVLDMVRDRLNLTERAARLIELHRKWKPKQVRWEQYGLMADIQHIKSVQEAEGYRFDIMEVAGRTGKDDRISRLIPIFEQGRIYFPKSFYVTDYEKNTRNLVHDFIEQEYLPFPVSAHKDMIDSLARIEEPNLKLVWPKEVQLEAPDRRVNAQNHHVNTGWMGH